MRALARSKLASVPATVAQFAAMLLHGGRHYQRETKRAQPTTDSHRRALRSWSPLVPFGHVHPRECKLLAAPSWRLDAMSRLDGAAVVSCSGKLGDVLPAERQSLGRQLSRIEHDGAQAQR